MFMRCFCLTIILLLAGCQTPSTTPQPYPSKPITLLVPWNPGGGTDTSSRALAAVLQDKIGVAVNVVNRTGGSGVVGHLALAQAKPDGYTLGAMTGEITMMHWTGLTDLTLADYTPLAMTVNNPAAVTVLADAPWNTLEELLADVRARPGEILASGTSKNGIWDIARMGLLEKAGLPETAMPWIPSPGGAAPAMQELMAGGVQVLTIALAEAAAQYRSGQVKVLGVMAAERLAAYPDVPTLAEQGFDVQVGGWVSVAAPAGLPDSILVPLSEAIRQATADSAFTGPLQTAGHNLQFMEGNALTSFLAAQDELNGRLLGN